MDKLRMVPYEAALRAKNAELIAVLKDREGIEVNSEPDLFDEVQTAVDRALLIRNLDRSSALLREVQAALARIAEGSYGECIDCGKEISPKRLAAAPWAPLCLDCQELAERMHSEAPDYDVAA